MKIRDPFAVGRPLRLERDARASGQLFLEIAVGRHHENVHTVLFDPGVGDAARIARAVLRLRRVGYAGGCRQVCCW